MRDPARVALILLAAGQGARFGGDKLMALVGGRPLVERTLGALDPIPFGQRIAVVANGDTPLGHLLDAAGYEVHVNPRAAQGMGTSLAYGALAVSMRMSACLVALADMPLVPTEHLRALLAAPADMAASHVGSHALPPALFDRVHFHELERLEGDRGARGLLAGAHAVPLAARFAHDVDTPDDLALLEDEE